MNPALHDVGKRFTRGLGFVLSAQLRDNVYFFYPPLCAPSSLCAISIRLRANVANRVLPAIFLKRGKRDVCRAAANRTEPCSLRSSPYTHTHTHPGGHGTEPFDPPSHRQERVEDGGLCLVGRRAAVSVSRIRES